MDKKYNKDALKDVLYGTIRELTNNQKFYYRGISDQFNYITEEGQAQIIIALDRLIPLIQKLEDEEIEERYRGMTFDILKDDLK